MNQADFVSQSEVNFQKLSDALFADLKGNENLTLNLNGEDSLFLRFNGPHVRQNTQVQQQSLSMRLMADGRTFDQSLNLTGNLTTDTQTSRALLEKARKNIQALPEDPYQVATQNNGKSHHDFGGKVPSGATLIEEIIEASHKEDLSGLFCGGPVIRANRNSQGQNHWFSTESFFFDYSLYQGPKAVKKIIAGAQWETDKWQASIQQASRELSLMTRPERTLKPGAYRAYLAPGAVNEILGIMSWGALSSGAWKQGQCPFKNLANGEASLSKLFSLRENFGLGLTPAFNSLGEVSPDLVPLIEHGRWLQFLTSSRTEKEYGLPSNGASESEGLRSPEILPGSLEEVSILKELGTGVYLNNLHYLNWSDREKARVTGMTRYACFWVENGEIVGPMKDLRFDEGLYEAFGQKLIGVTKNAEIIPETSTYYRRAIGGAKVPGLLIDGFTFTL
jgi:predicted Zn-dependent protease